MNREQAPSPEFRELTTAVVLDMDGTLLNTVQMMKETFIAAEAAINRQLEDEGREKLPAETLKTLYGQYRTLIGKQNFSPDQFFNYCSEFNLDLPYDLVSDVFLREVGTLAPEMIYEDVRAALPELQKSNLVAVFSQGEPEWQRYKKDLAFGWPSTFDEGMEFFFNDKTSSEALQHIHDVMQERGITRVILVEDRAEVLQLAQQNWPKNTEVALELVHIRRGTQQAYGVEAQSQPEEITGTTAITSLEQIQTSILDLGSSSSTKE